MSRHAISKAAMTTSSASNGILTTEQADRFIDLVVDESTLLKEVDTRRVDGPSGEFTKMDISSPITELAGEGDAAGSVTTSQPTFTNVTYSTKKLRSALDVTGEWIEDNIGGANGRTQVMSAFAKAISNDTEQLSIEGDDSLSPGSATNNLLRAADGWHTQTAAGTGTNMFNMSGTRVNLKALLQMKGRLPTRYHGDLENYRWIASPRVIDDFLYVAGSRATDAGDSVYKGNPDFAPLGIPFLAVPKIPNDLSISGTGATGSFIWLANPKNFIWVIQRALRMETERKPREDIEEVTFHYRADFITTNTDAIVKATNVAAGLYASEYS